MTPHDRDHGRLDEALAKWRAAGRPKTSSHNRSKAQLARTLGLRLDAHVEVMHKRPDLRSHPARLRTFDDIDRLHREAHR